MLPLSTLRRARRAVAAVFLVNGIVFGSWAPHIPLVQERLALSPAVLGTALLAIAGGALVAMLASGAVIARFGSAPVTAASTLALCLALPLPVLAPNLPLLVAALACLGAANGLMDVAMNAHGVAVETRLMRPIMSSLHGMYSLGGLIGAGVGALLLEMLPPAAHVLATAGGLLAVALVALPRLLPGRVDVGGEAGPHFVLPSRTTLGLGALCFLVMMSEGSALDWSAAYLRHDLGTGTSFAAAGFAAFSAAMAVGRFGGDRLRQHVGAVALVRGSAFLAAAGLGLALLVGVPVAAVLGFTCMGLGLSNLVPVLFGTAGRLPGQEPGAAIAATASVGYLGFLAGPPLIGLAAQGSSLGVALGLVVLACGLVGACAGTVRIADAPRALPAGERR
ncbi:MFS transporter [Benzoatithermus flavus]|uniref:MFS transporter n=1 Tax=Benzoatithermus flavus TaxID=3108223 RepID=A0ABU8XTK7_9PROT